MTSAMFRNRSHVLILGAAAIVALLSLAALLALRSSGALAPAGEPSAKGTVEARSAPTADARPERGATRDAAPAPSSCASCCTVEAIRTLEVRGEPTGSQELEQHLSRRVVYRVTVRLDDGSYRTLSQPTPPAIAVGAKVRIVDAAVVARQ
jgi:hypothetical protein